MTDDTQRYGFTPFAKEFLLYPSGHVRDSKQRVYVLGGKDADGKRVRVEVRDTLLVVFFNFTTRVGITHLWVKWHDGTRRLVHRKSPEPWKKRDIKPERVLT